MHRYISGVLALVALVQGISCRPATTHIDALAQKLEDHYHGKNLANEITFAEVQSACTEFSGINLDADFRLPQQPEPLYKTLYFLRDFMYLHLNYVPGEFMKVQVDSEAAKEFIRSLEEAYKRFRPIYNLEFSVYDLGVTSEVFLRPINHLAGKGELPDGDQTADAIDIAKQVKDSISEILEQENAYENLDDLEMLLKVWSSPEILSWTNKVWPLFHDQDKQDKYFAGDEAAVREMQQAYQDGIAEVIKNIQSE